MKQNAEAVNSYFRKYIIENKISATDVAEIIDSSYNLSYKKIKGLRDFTIGEILKLALFYDIDLNELKKGVE